LPSGRIHTKKELGEQHRVKRINVALKYHADFEKEVLQIEGQMIFWERSLNIFGYEVLMLCLRNTLNKWYSRPHPPAPSPVMRRGILDNYLRKAPLLLGEGLG